MALPTSRNRTYVNGATYVDATDLNDIQDAIIGGKHGELEFNFGAGSFLVENPANASIASGFERWDVTASVGLRLTLPFPKGTVINELRWVYDRVGVGTITLQLKKSSLGTGGASADVIADTPIAAGTGIASTTSAGIGYTMEADHQVVARAVCNTNGHRFYGVRVKVTRP